jgi:hypothetical protein
VANGHGTGFELSGKSDLNRYQPVILESLTLLVMLGFVLSSVRPLLEEWGVINALNAQGFDYLRAFMPEIIMRPLHLMPYAMEWVIGNGRPVGVAAGVAVLLLMRYFVMRWAVSPFFHGHGRWILATSAAVLVAWPGVWLGRFSSAQMSAVFFFAAFGFAARLFGRWSVAWVIGCACSVLLLLMTYQGLALCLFAIPLVSLFWRRFGDANAAEVSIKERGQGAARIFFSVSMGFVIYAVYWLVMSQRATQVGYEGALASDGSRLLSLVNLWSHIKLAYATAYGQEATLLPFLVLIAFFLYWNRTGMANSAKALVFMALAIFLSVALLPLLSVIYISDLHIRDVDRVLYPVSIGFVLICVTVAMQCHDRKQGKSGAPGASIIVAALLTASGLAAYQVRHYAKVQKLVISQTLNAVSQHNGPSVIIRDMTGTLGDVYTLLPPTLTDALALYGRNIATTICTPFSVDRIHPVARRYPIPSTPRCEELPAAPPGTMILSARFVDGVLTVSR